MLVIGLNAYHGDASACIVRDGRVVAAAEEERFRRIKHWAGFPSEAIGYCLKEAGVSLRQVDHIAVNSQPGANIMRRFSYAAIQRPALTLILDRLRNQNKRASVAGELLAAFPDDRFEGTVHRVEHHLAHLASAFLVSPFEEAVAVSVDGFGDFASAGWGVGRNANLSIDGRVWFPHSLGAFYQAVTQYLGFPHYGDEYKVMGLAPYGEAKYLREMSELVRLHDDGTFSLNLAYFRHHKEKIDYEWSGGSPHVGTLFAPALASLLGPTRGAEDPIEDRHRHIARSAQAMYEQAFFHLLVKLHARYGLDSLTLAGGCAMNSVANGKIKRSTPFKRLYIQAAAGDAGGAIGAAVVVCQRVIKVDNRRPPNALGEHRGIRRFVMDSAYLGPDTYDDEVAAVLRERRSELSAQRCEISSVSEEDELCRLTAAEIATGRVIGWFQGRMEWGPRALGNRSIVCDPRRGDMKVILNQKIKRRESFRPFAPSILREEVANWFEEEDDVPFMMQVFQVREEKRSLIPAVTHVDGSGRLQTVHFDTNPRYHKLIQAFHKLTGVPILLNTSFNENEPIVCRPHEAVDCFLRTKMDLLVLGNTVINRQIG